MLNLSGLESSVAWFQETGPEHDVAISSRLRLSRNLVKYSYPNAMSVEDEEKVQKEVESAFASLPAFKFFRLRDIEPIERKLLLERNIITQGFSLQEHKAVVLREDERISAMVGEIDHLRMACFEGGLNLWKAYTEVDAVDEKLEDILEFAVSLERGYLSSEIMNAGTGLRASVMLHLPSLSITHLIDKALKSVVQMGFVIKGFFGDDEHSLGDMYQISNQYAFGQSEQEILEKLQNICLQIVQYERKARDEMVGKSRMEIEDKVYRAYGILRYCRTITSKEAVDHLSALRLGIALGWVKNVPIERITALLFLTQKSHVHALLGKEKDGNDSRSIDRARAQLIQKALEEGSV